MASIMSVGQTASIQGAANLRTLRQSRVLVSSSTTVKRSTRSNASMIRAQNDKQQPPATSSEKLELKDSEKLPPWARNEKERELAMSAAKSDFPIPFALSLILSAFVAIAAVGAVFVWVDKDPIFGVLYPDNFLWAPILGFLALTGLPSAGFLFYKGVTGFNEASDLQDKLDGYN